MFKFNQREELAQKVASSHYIILKMQEGKKDASDQESTEWMDRIISIHEGRIEELGNKAEGLGVAEQVNERAEELLNLPR